MTADEIALVRDGFARIAPAAHEVGLAFYATMLDLDPAMRPLFRGDIGTQADHLMAALTMVVRSLHDLAPVLRQIEALGRRHAGYGVTAQHLETGGTALLMTLQAGLGAAFTPAARAAWTRAYATLAGAMAAAMAQAEPAAA